MSSNKLIRDLMGTNKTVKTASVESSQLTDPVYVEKLASAIDFIHDNYETFGLSKEAMHVPGHSADDKKSAFKKMIAAKEEKEEMAAPHGQMADKVKSKLVEGLKDRMKKKEAEASVQDDAVVQSVLGKLLRMRAEVEAPAEEKAEEAPEQQPQTEPDSPVEEETEVKAASLADLSLADVLEGALRANELEEGVSKERSKTASVRGEKGPMARKAAVQTLKQGLMAKFGKEA